MKKPKRILILRTDRLGDVILSTPAIRNLRLAYPDAHIAFLCRPYTRQAVEGNPYLDEVIEYDKHGRHKSFSSTVRFSFWLRTKKFDWAVVLHPTNRANMIVFLAGIPLRVGFNRKTGYLLNKRIPHKKQQGKKHEVEYTLDILRYIGVEVKDKVLYFPVIDKARKVVDKLFNSKGVDSGKKLLVIHPSASCPSKRWSQNNFSRLIRVLKAANHDLIIAVITSEAEKKFGKKLVEENDVVDLRGKLNLAELGALLERASLLISNDTGPVHIAAALKIPVISIFGRNDPGLSPLRWRPLGKNSYYLHKDVGCKKCLAHNCDKNFLCLQSIAVEEVFELAIKFLKSN
ncbi:MAG: glycosyltransferase family 9 protein [Candidatus Omnitrophica bacterium]|nr:glycosyltransferase family 9 protein [Candidatus Omnitrophota bacterium]MDD5429111.1 glycosyltransferase family 9 protein [Candidatus Omnitrophota bacterium]